MITPYQVYCAFRRAQSLSTGKPYRLPKSWEAQMAKMSEPNLRSLERTAGYFNTTYSAVDLEEYMKCGFELYKGFTYTSLLKKEVLQHYIQKDKVKKRKVNASKEDIDNTFENIHDYLNDVECRKGYSKLQSFCKDREGEVRKIINLYNKGLIDQMTFIYCINKKYIVLTDDERALIPYISQRYRDLLDNLYDVIEYIQEKEKGLEV